MLEWFSEHWKKIIISVFVMMIFTAIIYSMPHLKTSITQSFEDCGYFDDYDEFEECLKGEGITLSDDFLAFDDEEWECDPEDSSDDCELAKKDLEQCEKRGTDDCSEEKKALITEVKKLEPAAEIALETALQVKTPSATSVGSAGQSGPSGPSGPAAGTGPIAMMPLSTIPTKPAEKSKTEPVEEDDNDEAVAGQKKTKRKKRTSRQPAEINAETRPSTPTVVVEPSSSPDLSVPSVPEPPSEPHPSAELATPLFSDVYVANAHVPEIVKVREKGIMQGSPDPENPEKRLFKPEGLINRAELAAVLTRWLFPQEVAKLKAAKSCLFPDVPKDQWFFPNVTVACFHLLVKGYPDKTFKPDKTINYAEAIKVIVEGAGQFSPKIVGKALAAEKKALKKGEQWFIPYIRTAKKTGMLVGPELEIVNTSPADFATRGWVAYVIANIPGL